MPKTPIAFTLNGRETAVHVDPGQNLLETLRRQAGDMSPKYGCGQGGCGACSVIIDGSLRLSCLTLAETSQGKTVETADGLAAGDDLHPLQQAFVDHFAAQCGYCTPGMLMAAKALLDADPQPSRDDAIDAISGNLCRCTGYEPIVDAILDAATRMRERQA